MTPRPPPARDDVSACYFLDAAAELIDAMFAGAVDDRPRRLRGVHFPAALEWMRVSDVVEIAQARHGEGASEKAFRNRWPDRNSFVRAAIVHTMSYRDAPDSNPAHHVVNLPGIVTAARMSDAVIALCDGLLGSLQSSPRSYLLLHIGVLLERYPDLKDSVLADIVSTRQPWYAGYAALAEAFGIRLRPGWSIERLGLALQAMLDGFLFRSRLQADEMNRGRLEETSLFADTVVAFILGVIDLDGFGQTARSELDTAVGKGASPARDVVM